ncbi:MAG: hypothetical protein M3Y84_14285 [Acidobacteriota bacterium]|nr:hypothetical protein [Acidobacteriota bacterium]
MKPKKGEYHVRPQELVNKRRARLDDLAGLQRSDPRSLKRLIGSSLIVLCVFSLLMAQDEKRVGNQSTPVVTPSASSGRVRFAAPGSIVQVQVEVFSEGGEKLFEASQSGNVLDWAVRTRPASASAMATICAW